MREICLARRDAPLVITLIRLHVAHNDLKERRFSSLVAADKCHLVGAVDNKVEVLKDHLTVDRL